ncbi:hypothetical protein DFJ77DRAFT_542199 [Powellomyces hirtus]|nr:hypothetical protein DFJ77DRAFT_542199 [Powellomyces hirtus]
MYKDERLDTGGLHMASGFGLVDELVAETGFFCIWRYYPKARNKHPLSPPQWDRESKQHGVLGPPSRAKKKSDRRAELIASASDSMIEARPHNVMTACPIFFFVEMVDCLSGPYTLVSRREDAFWNCRIEVVHTMLRFNQSSVIVFRTNDQKKCGVAEKGIPSAHTPSLSLRGTDSPRFLNAYQDVGYSARNRPIDPAQMPSAVLLDQKSRESLQKSLRKQRGEQAPRLHGYSKHHRRRLERQLLLLIGIGVCPRFDALGEGGCWYRMFFRWGPAEDEASLARLWPSKVRNEPGRTKKGTRGATGAAPTYFSNETHYERQLKVQSYVDIFAPRSSAHFGQRRKAHRRRAEAVHATKDEQDRLEAERKAAKEVAKAAAKELANRAKEEEEHRANEHKAAETCHCQLGQVQKRRTKAEAKAAKRAAEEAAAANSSAAKEEQERLIASPLRRKSKPHNELKNWTRQKTRL